MRPLAFVLSHDVTVPEILTVSQFDRELASLENQVSVFGEVVVISRDRPDPQVRLPLPGAMHVRSRWLHRFPRLYAWAVPLAFAGALRGASGVYYHHYVAAFGAPLARRLWGARYALACNWMKSEVMAVEGYPVRAALHRRLEAMVLGHAELITIGSPHLERAVRERAGARVEIMPRVHYVDPERFPPKADYERGGVFQLVAVGRLAPVKDYPLMIRALAGRNDMRLTILGRGAEEAELRRLAGELRAPVVFEGYLENSRLAGRLREFDAFLMTSRYEGTPKGLMEAMACGLPCLGRDTPAFHDLLEHGRGLLAAGRAEALRAALERLAGDARLRQDLGCRAREHILSQHSRERSERQERAALERFRDILLERARAHAAS